MKLKEHNINDVVFMTSPNITATHAFTTRIGGVSSGIYKSLNLALKGGDEPENVHENYSRLCNAVGTAVSEIVCSNQVHGTFVRVITKEDSGKFFSPNPHRADALVTKEPDIALMIFTADCVPILLYDPIKKAAGAIHAGWRGTTADIAGVTIRTMVREFDCSPADIKAAIGPCISKCCFQTDNDVADAVREILPQNFEECVAQQANKYMVDLKEVNRILLSNTGVTDISISDECTACLCDKYWSHRITQGNRGSQGAIIKM